MSCAGVPVTSQVLRFALGVAHRDKPKSVVGVIREVAWTVDVSCFLELALVCTESATSGQSVASVAVRFWAG